jgi:hypothetical protein
VKILLDECIDWRFARELSGHQVTTVPQMCWATTKNGALLKLAEQAFDVFVTVDRNLSFQQPLAKFSIAVVVLRSKSNRLSDLTALAPELRKILPGIKRGDFRVVEA